MHKTIIDIGLLDPLLNKFNVKNHCFSRYKFIIGPRL